MPKKLSQEEFIERCKKKHNNYYSYDKTVYTGMSNDDYIIVTCPTRHLYATGLTNPTYHALEAMAVNAIESEETADFEDINETL